jgi:hypothetical protein
MGSRAAIFVQRGFPADRQTTMCLRYAVEEQHYTLLAIVPHWAPEDACKLVRDGTVDVVVAAFDSKAVTQLAADLPPAGRVEVVHPRPHVVERPHHRLGSVADLVVRWWNRGRCVRQIADDLDEPTGEVRDLLRRLGMGEQTDR